MHLDAALKQDIFKIAEMALIEDLGGADLQTGRDCTTLSVVPDDIEASATFSARQNGVICGLQVCQIIIDEFSPDLELRTELNDGESVSARQSIATLEGEARQILMIERTCLNFMCRLSGISTFTNKFVRQVAGTAAQILDTRKTIPGWRRLEKHAVACGGGHNHRMGLYDAVMIKDNHLAMYGSYIEDHKLSVTEAIELARKWIAENQGSLPDGRQTIVQIEVDTLDQLENALSASPDIVLLDNMNVGQLVQAVGLRNERGPDVLLEASGGVNLETVRAIADTGVDRISVGALTHSAGNFDIGLDWGVKQRLSSSN